jgi:hypothetical protein
MVRDSDIATCSESSHTQKDACYWRREVLDTNFCFYEDDVSTLKTTAAIQILEGVNMY